MNFEKYTREREIKDILSLLPFSPSNTKVPGHQFSSFIFPVSGLDPSPEIWVSSHKLLLTSFRWIWIDERGRLKEKEKKIYVRSFAHGAFITIKEVEKEGRTKELTLTPHMRESSTTISRESTSVKTTSIRK